MNKRQETWVRTKWVPALLSGKYSQGQGKLRLGDNVRCCLGVACDLVSSDAWTTDEERKVKRYFWVDPLTGYPHETFLPLSVQKKSGIKADGGFIVHDVTGFPIEVQGRHEGYVDSLSRLNDQGKSFTLIADVVLWILDHPEQAEFRRPVPPGSYVSGLTGNEAKS